MLTFQEMPRPIFPATMLLAMDHQFQISRRTRQSCRTESAARQTHAMFGQAKAHTGPLVVGYGSHHTSQQTLWTTEKYWSVEVI